MDLYGDLPEVKGDKKGTRSDNRGFSTGKLDSEKAQESMSTARIRPAMSQVAIKRHAPTKRMSQPSTMMPSQARSSVKTQDLLSTPMQPTGLDEGSTENAYDPAQPNDYEKIMEERRNKRFQVDRELVRLKQERLEKKKKTVMMEKEEDKEAPTPIKGMDLAQKMLEKMGWKKGQGLGKHKQGIRTALAVEKTNARSGRVVLPSLKSDTADQKDIQPPKNPPSRVIILTNVVGPGGVDESLDQEVGEECSESFGEVTNVLIFEVTDSSYPPDKAVRIFVEFADQDSAVKAVQHLNGRYFDGRVVRADFFDQQKFDAEQLAPSK